jgi:Ca2+-binding RTX toxin-like protein
MLNTVTGSLATTIGRSPEIASLVMFDSRVTDLPLLYNALLPGSIGYTIQPDRDPIETIANLLTETGATKLAIVAHGQPGAIQIGNGAIDRAMLEARAGLLQEWGVDSIALYSCEVGADKGFIQRFGELTGAQISAATNKVGTGNWELDGGERMLAIGQLGEYSDTLAIFTGTVGNDNANISYIYVPPLVGGIIFVPAAISGFSDGDPLTNDLTLLTDAIGDTFNGLDGSDSVRASSGDDTLNGGGGEDTLNGGAGSNILNGGDNNDNIFANLRDTVDGGIGQDSLQIEAPSTDAYTVEFTGADSGKFKTNSTQTGTFTGIERLTFFGNAGNDTIDASLASSDSLYIFGSGGSDTVLGSAGNDSIYGGNDNDYLLGQGGNDTINGEAGFDIIFGGSGVDTISGGELNDTIFGGIGNDAIYGGNGEDYLYGEEDNDSIYGGYGFDVIYGQAGNDTIYGEGVTFVGDLETTTAPASGVGINDTIFGGIGNDAIYGGIGEDYLYGEEDNDSIHGNDGLDVIYGQAGEDYLYGDAGNDYLVGGAGFDQLYGGDGIDQLNGENGNDFLYGDAGDDSLYGNDGFDYLHGDAGNDFLDGGIGDDFLTGDTGNDVLLGGDGNDTLYGGNTDAGIDYLYGGSGNDTLFGGGGSDFLIGGAGSDSFGYYAMNNAGDSITDFDPLAGGDKLDLSSLFSGLGIASSSVNTNYLNFVQSGANTLGQVDQDGVGTAYGFVTLATLNNVTVSQLSFGVGGNVLV